MARYPVQSPTQAQQRVHGSPREPLRANLHVNPSFPLLAIRVADVEFALESGRVYLLGRAAQCDFCPPGGDVPEMALTIRLHEGTALVAAPGQQQPFALRLGGTARLAGIEIQVVADRGEALILPLPAPQRAMAPAAVPAASLPRTTPAAKSPSAPVATGERTFTDLLAHELRHTPWYVLSLLLHALLLMAAWLLLGSPPPPPEAPARYGFEAEAASDGNAPQGPEEIPVELETSETRDLQIDPAPASQASDEANDAPPADMMRDEPLLLIGGERIPKRSGSGATVAPSGATGTDGGDPIAGGGGSGGFRQTVSDLRKSGLEIVFVFDSTGSMGSSITATKSGIAAMLEVLGALVPDARFSLITYRDKGAGEEYLVRSLPLCHDFFAAVNFMQTIAADGGGDTPEAVLAGLREAVDQRWTPGARRVIVLAGDAPPHVRELRALLDSVRRFSNLAGSSVHTLLTNGERSGAAESFARIAQLGHGLCCPIEDQQRLLRKVLTLSFGNEFEQDIDAVLKRFAAERDSPPTWARDLARRGGPDLLTALDVKSVPTTLVHALVRRPSRAVLLDLVQALAGDSLQSPARNAIAHVLRETLDLPAAPTDPERPKPLTPTEAAALRKKIAQLSD